MAKSNLQKEYDKQLRLLQRRIKALQKQGHTFNPEQIKAITKHKSKPTSKDIEKLKSLKRANLRTVLKTPSSAPISSSSSSPSFSTPTVSKPRIYESETVLKERANYRARVLRLKNQGYDVSKLKKANELSLSELQSLKGSALSDLIYKDGKTATQLRKEQAQQRRSETYHKKYAERERKERENNKFIPHTPEEIEKWLAKNKERAMYDQFKQPTMIERIEVKIQALINYIYSNEWMVQHLQAPVDTLQGLWWDILYNVGYPDNPETYTPYESYLEEHEVEIMVGLDLIYHYGEGVDTEAIDQSLVDVMQILNKGTITLSQAQTLGEMHER